MCQYISQETHHGEVAVICGQAQAQLGLHLWSHAPQHTVEDVVVPLIWGLKDNRESYCQPPGSVIFLRLSAGL